MSRWSWISWGKFNRFSKLIIYGFFPPSPSSSLFDYCMFVFVATSVRSKICYRQETAVRTVAQTLGGIAVFRFPCLLFEIWFCLIQARNSSLQGDSNSLGSRNRRDPCWSLPLRSLQCKKVNERSISTWWRLCSNVWHRCARRTWPCPFCTARSSRGLPPSSVVLDLVLLLSKNLSKIWQSSIPKAMYSLPSPIHRFDKSHSQILGKVEYGWGPIFKVVLEC